MNDTDGGLRIGELARRTGVSPDLLRAWEQRYDLLHPARSPGGFRLYSRDDEARIRRMTELIGQGLSAAEAARQARTAPEPPPELRHDATNKLHTSSRIPSRRTAMMILFSSICVIVGKYNLSDKPKVGIAPPAPNESV